MVTKTFRSESMLEALQMAQKELGSDAIVISTREVPAGPSWNPWKLTAVEIVAAGANSAEEGAAAPQQEKSAAPAPILRPSANSLGVEFIEEKPEIEWVSDPVLPVKPAKKLNLNLANKTKPAVEAKEMDAPAAGTAAANPSRENTSSSTRMKTNQRDALIPAGRLELPAGLKRINQQLHGQGVDAGLVEGLINVAMETLSPAILSDYLESKKYISQLLASELRIQKDPVTVLPANIISVVGPSGSGKTCCIAKLSLLYTHLTNKKITWVCADTVKMGAVAEARAYTDAMGISLKLVYDVRDLSGIVNELEENDLILLDTAGYNPWRESQMVELGALLAGIPKRCTYLAAPSTMKESDLFQLSASFGVYTLDGLILTKLDETHQFGSAYNFARKSSLPLSFFSSGKEASSNFEQANSDRLIMALFGKEWNK